MCLCVCVSTQFQAESSPRIHLRQLDIKTFFSYSGEKWIFNEQKVVATVNEDLCRWKSSLDCAKVDVFKDRKTTIRVDTNSFYIQQLLIVNGRWFEKCEIVFVFSFPLNFLFLYSLLLKWSYLVLSDSSLWQCAFHRINNKQIVLHSTEWSPKNWPRQWNSFSPICMLRATIITKKNFAIYSWPDVQP